MENIKMLFNQKQINGITTELMVAHKFIELGYIVSIPYGNNSRYDMIVDTDKARYRVQVKHATANDNGSFTIKTCNTAVTSSGNKEKHYTKEDIDFIVSIIQNQLVVIPIELVEKSQSKIFRTELPKYGAKSNCNLIEDFTVEKHFL